MITDEENTMGIEIFAGDNTWLQQALQWCWGAKQVPSGLFASSDSINQLAQFFALAYAPRSVVMQLETHKKTSGFYLWMQSARPDIGKAEFVQGYSREQTVKFAMLFNASSLKYISHLRLCGKAESQMRQFMFLWRRAMMEYEIAPMAHDLAMQMMPLCAYRGGKCTELHGCGACWTEENWNRMLEN